MFTQAMLIIGAYLLGSLSSAVIVCRSLDLGDPRAVGSGNPGTTNVLRNFGKQAAALTLAGDSLKGLIPVLLAQGLNFPVTSIALVAVAAFLGHLFPCYFQFRGGKGVATYAGVLFGLALPLGLVFGLCWIAVAFLSRYASLAGLVAAPLSVLTAILFGFHGEFVAAMVVMVGLLFWRHRGNLRNLLQGTEGRIEL